MHDKINTSHKSIILTFEYLQMFNDTMPKIYVNFCLFKGNLCQNVYPLFTLDDFEMELLTNVFYMSQLFYILNVVYLLKCCIVL